MIRLLFAGIASLLPLISNYIQAALIKVIGCVSFKNSMFIRTFPFEFYKYLLY